MKLSYEKLYQEFLESGEKLPKFCKQRSLVYSSICRAFEREGLPIKSEARAGVPNVNSPEQPKCLPVISEVCASGFTKPNSRATQKNRSGNRNPSNLYQKGNQSARKHGGYAKFIEEDDFIAAGATTLEDELVLFRSRMQSCLRVLDKVTQRISQGNVQDLEKDLALISSTENAIDRISTRIESLERTITSMELTSIATELKEAEKEHKIAITEKVKLEVERLRKLESEGGDADFAIIMRDITAMEQGLLSVVREKKNES